MYRVAHYASRPPVPNGTFWRERSSGWRNSFKIATSSTKEGLKAAGFHLTTWPNKNTYEIYSFLILALPGLVSLKSRYSVFEYLYVVKAFILISLMVFG